MKSAQSEVVVFVCVVPRYGESSWVNGTKVDIDTYGTTDATDLTALMSEVYQNGPIACYSKCRQ